jgi:hypothetical protein
MVDKLFLDPSEEKAEKENRTVVRLVTSAWNDKRGVHVKKTLRWMQRLSYGFNCLEEDCTQVGTEEAIRTVLNLYDVKDGLYEVVMVNERRDWETGYVEEWEFKLHPFNEPPASSSPRQPKR